MFKIFEMTFAQIFKDRSYLLLTIITLVSCLFFFAIITPFSATIILSGIFVVGIAPLVEKIRVKYGIARQRIFWGIVIIGVAAFFALTSICVFRIYDLTLGEDNVKSVAVLNNLRNTVGSFSSTAEGLLRKTLTNLGVKSSPKLNEQTQELFKKTGNWVFLVAGKFFSSLPELIIHFLVFLIMLFIFYKYRNSTRKFLIKYNFATESEMNTVITLLQNSGGSMLSANLIVGTVQAAVVTLGAAIVSLNEWSIIFTLTFICSFIPVVGAAPIGFLLSLFSFLMGHQNAGIFMIIVAIISGTVDNVIRPYLIARTEENLNPFITLVGLIGAVSIFGFHGIFIGPFFMSVAASALPKLLEAVSSTQVPKSFKKSVN